MRYVMIAALAALSITACDKTTGQFNIAEVQGYARAACAFEPTAQTVLNIFKTGSPALDTASEVAAAICAAVNTPQAKAGAKPVVAGVPVEGRRL